MYAVPVQGQVLQLDKARPLPPFVDEAGQQMNYPTVAGRTRFTDDAVFVNNFRYKFSKADGRLLGRNNYSEDNGHQQGYGTRCEYQHDLVVCLASNKAGYESFLMFLKSTREC